MAGERVEVDTGESARSLLVQIHRAIILTEVTIASLGDRVDQHIRDEKGLMGKVDALHDTECVNDFETRTSQNLSYNSVSVGPTMSVARGKFEAK